MRKKIVWDDGLLLGIDKLDDQHVKLIKYANKLIECSSSESQYVCSCDVFADLSEYTVIHFNEEEEFMKSIDYINFKEHAQRHLELKKEVRDFQKGFFHHIEISKTDIYDFMKAWLIDHILTYDMELKNFVDSRKKISQ